MLLKFIEKEKQWDVIKNSFDALKESGIAIHILDKEDYESRDVSINEKVKKLKELNIDFIEIEINYGKALVLQK